MAAWWTSAIFVTVDSSPEKFDAIIRSDAERYGKLLKAAGVAAN
jgi:tripartite-type tricarboxylate transporter receptor subunit TctC